MSVPAAWHQDPAGSGRMRWWDGSQWTDNYQEFPPAAASVPTMEPGVLWQAVGKPITGVGGGRYKLTSEFLFFEKGIMSSKAQQVPIAEVHDVDSAQSMQQKLRGVGTISLVIRRGGGDEQVALEDIADFREGVQAINTAARTERERLQARANTQTVNYAGGLAAMTPAPQPVQTAPAAQGEDIFAALEKLGKLRDMGIVTPEEFEEKKAVLMARI